MVRQEPKDNNNDKNLVYIILDDIFNTKPKIKSRRTNPWLLALFSFSTISYIYFYFMTIINFSVHSLKCFLFSFLVVILLAWIISRFDKNYMKCNKKSIIQTRIKHILLRYNIRSTTSVNALKEWLLICINDDNSSTNSLATLAITIIYSLAMTALTLKFSNFDKIYEFLQERLNFNDNSNMILSSLKSLFEQDWELIYKLIFLLIVTFLIIISAIFLYFILINIFKSKYSNMAIITYEQITEMQISKNNS